MLGRNRHIPYYSPALITKELAHIVKLTQTAVVSKATFPLWLIIVISVVAALLLLLIIVAFVMVCLRLKKAQPPGAHPNAAYRAQHSADEPAAALNQ